MRRLYTSVSLHASFADAMGQATIAEAQSQGQVHRGGPCRASRGAWASQPGPECCEAFCGDVPQDESKPCRANGQAPHVKDNSAATRARGQRAKPLWSLSAKGMSVRP